MKSTALVFIHCIIGSTALVVDSAKPSLEGSSRANFSYPPGFTGSKRPNEKPFCSVGSIDFSEVDKISTTVYIFDDADSSKSTHLHFNMALTKDSTPIGMNVTGGGCANVVDKKELGLVEGAVVLCTETIDEGVGTYNMQTKQAEVDFLLKADAEARVLGYDVIETPTVSKAVTAHIGPNNDFAFDASFEESTGNKKKKGMSIAFDLTMNTKDHSLFTWELMGALKFHVWWEPLFDEHPEVELFDEVFKIKL